MEILEFFTYSAPIFDSPFPLKLTHLELQLFAFEVFVGRIHILCSITKFLLFCCANAPFSIIFQLLRNLGILKDGEKLPWDLDTTEKKKFCDAWTRIYKVYTTKLQRQRQRGQDVSAVEDKLKGKSLICPHLFETIFGGLSPEKRKNARKRTYVHSFSKDFYLHSAQCGNFRAFLTLRFYVKSISEALEKSL